MENNTQRSTIEKRPSVLGGTMIVAGTIIGAGMLTLSTISAGMWTIWTIIILLLSFGIMFVSANMILEVNMFYPRGASFDTLVKNTLGPVWNVINGFTVAFVLYILVYAYISGGGSTIKHSLNLALPQALISFIFAIICALIVMWSTKAVDRVSVILMVGMIITLISSIAGLLPSVNFSFLVSPDAPKIIESGQKLGYSVFVLATLPYFLTSFCFHGSVPSLAKYFNKDSVSVRKCILYGLIIALIFYSFWMITNFGVLNREGLREVYAKGGNVGHLLESIQKVINSSWLNTTISTFAFFAVVTSFLGAGLGLFDYIADMLKFGDTTVDRAKTATITFIPPIIGGVFFPDGFIIAIGFAGLAAAIWSVIVPALMVRKSRQIHHYSAHSYKVFGGNLLIYIILIYGIVVAICHIFSPDLLNVLPVYK